MSLTHAEIYANVIKARPECIAGDGVSAEIVGEGDIFRLEWKREVRSFSSPIHAKVAIAIITDHWTEMLPVGHGIGRMIEGDMPWAVHDEYEDSHWFGPTRFHALAEFLVPGSTKETNKQ